MNSGNIIKQGLIYKEGKVPIVSMFFGIIIKMHFRDHNPPHFHAEYQGREAQYAIATGKLVDGEFPKRAQKIIESWAKEHRKELLDNWKRAQAMELLFMIEGADQ